MWSIKHIAQYKLFPLVLGLTLVLGLALIVGFFDSPSFHNLTRSPLNFALQSKSSERGPQPLAASVVSAPLVRGGEIQICSASKCTKIRSEQFVFSNSASFLSGTNTLVETTLKDVPESRQINTCKEFYMDTKTNFIICDNRKSADKNNMISYTMGPDLKQNIF